MENMISQKALSVQRTKIRLMYELQEKYTNVISFAVGEPDFNTPENIIKACFAAIKSGKTGYAPNSGINELKQAVAKNIFKTHNVRYDWKNEILITAGGMNALRSASEALVNLNDEVLVSNPYWSNHAHHPVLSMGKTVLVPVYEKNNFMYDVDDLKRYLTPKTKIIVLNSPSNPTGRVIDTVTLQKLCRFCIDNNLLMISDEVYQHIIYDGLKFESPVMFDGMKERTIICNSFSKTYAMTGWRLGYAAGPADMIAAMNRINENTIACANTFIQYAGVEALEGPQDSVKHMVEEFQKRRDIIYSGINAIEKLSCIKPQGAFYAFVNIKKTGLPSDEFCYRLLNEKQVCVIPGDGFGDAGQGYVRMSYALSTEKLVEGITRMKEFVDSL